MNIVRGVRDSVLLGVLVALVVLSYVLLAHVREQARPEPFSEGRVDFAVTDFDLTQVDPSGAAELRMQGGFWEHDQWSGEARIDQVEMQLYDAGTVRWELSANQGVINDDGSYVLLKGDVLVDYLPPASEAPIWQLKTSRLELFPSEDRFATEAEVLIERDTARINATGMRGSLASGQFELDEMDAVYEP